MLPSPTQAPYSVDLQKHLTSLHIDEWLKEDVLHPRWWILLAMIVLSLLVWYLLLDKAQLRDVCLYAALAAIFMLSLVEYGDELILWDYPTDVIPIFPPLTCINLFILPLAFSLIYQRFRTWRSFLIAALAVSAVICFAIEPLLAWGDFYQLVNWHYIFSFPVYFALAVLVKGITMKINEITGRNRAKYGRV